MPAKFALITQRRVIAQRKNKQSSLTAFVNPYIARSIWRGMGVAFIELYLLSLPISLPNETNQQGH